MRKLAFTLLLLIAPLAAHATAPLELKSLFRSNAAYSTADFTYLWMDVYRISLWTDESAWKADSRYALSITYNMGFTADELVDRSCDEMKRHHPNGKGICTTMRGKLLRAMPGVKEGDRITAVRTEEGGTRFFKNGAPTAAIDDATFTDTFFAIWLGENSSDPALRKQLVGQR